MLDEFLTYLKQLAVLNKQLLHDDNGRKAYFEFDWEAMTATRQRNEFVVFVHRIRGKANNNRGDNLTDRSLVAVFFLTKVNPQKTGETKEKIFACKALAEEVMNRIRYDRENSEDCAILELLRYVNLDEVAYEQIDMQADGWTGLIVEFPVTSPMDGTYDPTKWN